MVEKVVQPSMSDNMSAEEQKAHDQKMLDVAEAGVTKILHRDSQNEDRNVDLTQVAPDIEPRPDSIPEKFWNTEKGELNVEALLKSQKDGEDALRAAAEGKPAAPVVPDGDDKNTPTGDQSTEAQPKVVQDASAEFAKDGKLSDETYTALATSGLSKEMVDQYIDGQKAIVTTLQSAAAEPFGSTDQYNAAADWAAEHLSEEEVKVLDVQLTSMNPAIVKQGAAALQTKYAANADIAPDVTIQGDGNISTGTSFASSKEMQVAMSDSRYKTDPAFRQEVANKIARSGANLFG